MSDRSLPYYKWFWQDWRANRKIQRMSYIERGLYRELLDECWVEGFIPNDIRELADICGCPEDVMANAWQVLESCFELLEDGTLINEKLHSLRTEKDVERLRKSESGKKGGLAKALNISSSTASAKQVPSNCHIEEKRREKKIKEIITTPDGVDDSVFQEYLAFRKKNKKNWSLRIETGLREEGDKLNWNLQEVIEYCLKKGWVGFESSWVKDNPKSSINKPKDMWEEMRVR